MNHNSDFTALRSILHHVNDHSEPLANLQTVCGYQPVLEELVNRLKQWLREKNYVDLEFEPSDCDQHDALRRIVFYLMLNTNNPLGDDYDLGRDNAVVHLLQTTPQLPAFLLMHLVWSVGLHEFYAEAIAITPHWFATAYLSKAVAALNTSPIQPQAKLVRVQHLLVGIFRNIASHGEHLSERTIRCTEIAAELVQIFLTIDETKAAALPRRSRSAHIGHTLSHGIAAALDCIAFFQDRKLLVTKPKQLANVIFGILDSRNGRPSAAAAVKSEATDPELLTEDLRQLIVGLLNGVQTTLCQVSVDVFCDWAEQQLDEEFTMQRAIGESIYRLQQLIAADPRLEHSVLVQLQLLAVRPKTQAELAADAPLSEILERLDEVNLPATVRSPWLDEFLSRGILVFGNNECMDTLKGNLPYTSVAHISLMIRAVHQLHSLLDDSGDRLRKYIVLASSQRTIPEMHELIECSLQTNPPTGVDLELNTFSGNAIGFFNRCSRDDLNSPRPWFMILQNPSRFIEHAIGVALKGGALLAPIAAYVDSLPAPLFRAFVQSALVAEVRKATSMTDRERTHLTTLLVHFHRSQFERLAAFYQWVYRLLCEASTAGHLQTVICLLETLAQALQSHSEIRGRDENTATYAPLLVMCAAMMDTYRWDVVTYTAVRAKIVALAIDIMHVLRKRFLPLASEEERQFVCAKVAGFRPQTRYYYQRFALRVDQQPVEYVRFVLPELQRYEELEGEERTPEVDATLLEMLLGAMVRATRKECLMLAANARLRPYWFLAIPLLSRVVQASPSENSRACLRAAGQSLVHVVKNAFCPAAVSHEQKWALISDYIRMIHKLQSDEQYEDLFLDSYMVVVQLLSTIDSECQAAAEPGVEVAATAKVESTERYQRRRMLFRKAVDMMVDCPAKNSLLQSTK